MGHVFPLMIYITRRFISKPALFTCFIMFDWGFAPFIFDQDFSSDQHIQ